MMCRVHRSVGVARSGLGPENVAVTFDQTHLLRRGLSGPPDSWFTRTPRRPSSTDNVLALTLTVPAAPQYPRMATDDEKFEWSRRFSSRRRGSAERCPTSRSSTRSHHRGHRGYEGLTNGDRATRPRLQAWCAGGHQSWSATRAAAMR